MNTHDLSMQELFRLAEMLCDTQGFLPPHIRTPGEAMAVMMTGRELGLQPMASLRLIKLVKGNVTTDAAGQLGLMQSRGHAKIKWLKDGSDGEAVLWIKRPDDEPFESRYTTEMARTAGLLSNGTWQKHGPAMLRARCVTAAGKAYMADVMAGIYLPGEIEADPSEQTGHALPASTGHAQLPANAIQARPVTQTLPAPGGAPAFTPAQLTANVEPPRYAPGGFAETQYAPADAPATPPQSAPPPATQTPGRTITDVLGDINKCDDLSKIDVLIAEARAWYKTLPPALQHEVAVVCKAAPDAVKERDALRRERDEAEAALAARADAALAFPEPGAGDGEIDPVDAALLAQRAVGEVPNDAAIDIDGVF